jgi:hypothetical protein
MATDTVNYNLRLPRELHDRVKALAGEDRRSVNAEYVWLLEGAVDREERGNG